MKIGSAIVTVLLSAFVIFGVNLRPDGSSGSHPVHAANDQASQKKEPKDKDASARKKQGEDDTTIRVDTTLVTVPVVAMDRAGKFAPGLRAEDFRVFEEGVAQDIAFFLSAEEPVTVALMLDVSDSTESNLRQIQDAAIVFVDQLRPDDQVAVIEFDSGF
ncbi:MAG: hypothetical protein ACREAM_02225, partial [Blastocatellia bacterium]